MLSPSPPADQSNSHRLPSWLVSVTLHAAVATIVLLALQSQPRGAADEPTRQVGIVLKNPNADGDPYRGEETAQGDATQPGEALEANDAALLATLPGEGESQDAAGFLPQAPGLGAAELAGGGGADAMTQGGAPAGGSLEGGSARVRVFGVEGVGTKFVFAFDRSISMTTENRLAAAKRQLIESLQSLEPVHQFQIIFFNHRPTIPDLSAGQRRIAFATEQNKQTAERFIEGVAASGGTDRYAALNRALAMGPDVIFFLTDADDAMPAADMMKLRRRNARVGATICTIEFGSGPGSSGDNFLKRLARLTGGQYGYVDTTRLTR